jgi:hypothetical protein
MFMWYIKKRVRNENAYLLKVVQASEVTGELIDKLVSRLKLRAPSGPAPYVLNWQIAEIKQLIAEIRNHEEYKLIWAGL